MLTFNRLHIPLFWRTFLMFALLIGTSFALTMGIARILDQYTPEQRLAWTIASIVHLTRSALIDADAANRAQLLDRLEKEEDVRVWPFQAEDRFAPSYADPSTHKIAQHLYPLLGANTRASPQVNGQEGLWISFEIDHQSYWLRLPRQRIDRQLGLKTEIIWLIALGLSLTGALGVSRWVNRPLSDLAEAITAVSRGLRPAQLGEKGPAEIVAVHRGFNQLVQDLRQLDQDRSIALAGISHDIRGPLTRLRMEIELAKLPDTCHQALVADIERIDCIVGQFIQYARMGEPPKSELVSVHTLMSNLASAFRPQILSHRLQLHIDTSEAPSSWMGDPTDLCRILTNLVDNAMRYGTTASRRNTSPPDATPNNAFPQTGKSHTTDSAIDGAHVKIRVRGPTDQKEHPFALHISVCDQGPGMPADSLHSLLRPFARLDVARGEHGGSGLGLAIVDRLAKRYRGTVSLKNRHRGLCVEIYLQNAEQPTVLNPSAYVFS